MDYYQPLLPGEKYHILSRATGKEDLYTEPENYRFFLQRFHKYISPVADVFAYALLPNHFHFLVEIKPYDDLLDLYKQQKKQTPTGKEGQEHLSAYIMQQFSNLLNSYTKSFNKKYNRKGALFMDYLRRVPVTSGEQFIATVFYIHKNPVHHGLCNTMAHWKWSSFNSILSDAPAKIERRKIIEEFTNLQQFIAYHNQPIHLKNAVALE